MKKFIRALTASAFACVSFGFVLAHSPRAHAMGIRPPVAADPTPTPTPAPSPVVVAPQPAPTPRPPTPTPTPVVTAPSSSSSFTPLWSGKNKDAANWTIYAADALEAYGANLLKGPSDVESFCPMYSRLGHQDQINFWIQLLAGVAQYESSFNPTSYMVETTMGTDPITGSQVISAGLFQLSYQDTPNYKRLLPTGLCVFDYPSDSKLAMTDIKRTINDPKNNITCAVGIMNYLAGRHGSVAFDSGNYWSTLMPSSKYGKVPQIQAITKKLTFCAN